MARIWGFDIGTTSIGWAVIEHDVTAAVGRILAMGVRIFPEARDPDGTPLNQTRRQKRMARRQLRRRRERRKALNLALADAGLLPPFSKDKGSEWARVMALPPLPLRARALKERVEPHELGRVCITSPSAATSRAAIWRKATLPKPRMPTKRRRATLASGRSRSSRRPARRSEKR